MHRTRARRVRTGGAVARCHSVSAAPGFVASRVLEAAIIVLGAVSLLSVVSMRQDAASAVDFFVPADAVVRRRWSSGSTPDRTQC
ncbi:MAG: hypothetical protein LH624_15010, partial [Cryobacterium sp.]|nr:hypothetical protein [Cryobacterium sp.]